MVRPKGSGDYADFNGRTGRVGGSSFYAGPYALQAIEEAGAHTDSVHASEVVAERKVRERVRRYEDMKREMMEARAASD